MTKIPGPSRITSKERIKSNASKKCWNREYTVSNREKNRKPYENHTKTELKWK